jgi:hypothetical protein
LSSSNNTTPPPANPNAPQTYNEIKMRLLMQVQETLDLVFNSVSGQKVQLEQQLQQMSLELAKYKQPAKKDNEISKKSK